MLAFPQYWMMNDFMKYLLIQLAMVTMAFAGLTFEKTLTEFHPKADEQQIVADFAFRNDHEKEVRIVKYDAACSCMEVSVLGGKLHYAPGEAGVIRAIFKLTGYQGTTDRVVAIWLDGDPDETPSARLTVRAHIPHVIKFEPKTLTWELSGPPDAKTISIEMSPERAIHVLRVMSTDPNFHLEIKTLDAGKRYELVVTPQNTDTPGLAAFRIDTDSKIDAYKSQSVFGVIRKPLP